MSSQPEVKKLVLDYLQVLANERASSQHTLRAYARELNGFADYLIEQMGTNVRIARVEHQQIRAFLGALYDRGLSKASVARALASIRSWYRWLARAGHV